MALTVGTGPFARTSPGTFNFKAEGPEHVLFWDPSPKRVRATFAGRTVVDSRNAKLLHETGHLPVYYFPVDDVDQRLLERSDTMSHCPFKGDASTPATRTTASTCGRRLVMSAS